MGLWTCKLVRELPRPLGQDEDSGISIGECRRWGNNEKNEGGWRWLYLRPAHRVGVVNQLVEVVEVLFDVFVDLVLVFVLPPLPLFLFLSVVTFGTVVL